MKTNDSIKNLIKVLLSIVIIIAFMSGLLLHKNDKKEVPTNNDVVDEEVVTYKELFEEYYDKATEKLNDMTLEEKVGQLFIIKMESSKVKEYINKYHPGGFVLFGVDFKNETKTSLIKNINKYQSMSSIPLVIAVDEEGGTVTRVSSYPNFRKEKFPSSQDIYKKGGFELIEEVELEKINLLKDLGINLNFAPVADVTTNSKAYMYKRSFGADAKLTSEYISRVVKLDVENNFAGTLKHFPGYGNNVDTHVGIATDKRDYDEFTTNDYLPFKAGIDSKVPVIMMSHNIVLSMDSKLPASLSLNVHQELRNKLEFSGLIITDDLAMGAITKYVDKNSRSVLAFSSGNDLIITGDIETDYPNLLNAIKNGKIDEKELDIAVRRILAFKYQYEIIK